MDMPRYPVTVIAKLLNISPRRVQQLAKEKIIPPPIKGKYDLVGCVQGYCNYLQDRAFGKDVGPQDSHLERARLLKAQADKTELEVATLQGRLVHVEQVAKDWRGIVMTCRSKLLALPSKSAFQIAGLGGDAHEIERFLKRLIYEALTELAEPNNYEHIRDYENAGAAPESYSDGDIVGAAAGTDSESVGGSTQAT